MENNEVKLSFDKVLAYLLAGNAVFTLLNTKTNVRFTFKVKQLKEDDEPKPLWFVSLLSGPCNTSDYSYLGCIWEGKRYSHGKKSRIGRNTPSAKAFAWFFGHLVRGSTFPDVLEVYHNGYCGRCNRELTVPESVELGLGPVCAEKVASALGL